MDDNVVLPPAPPPETVQIPPSPPPRKNYAVILIIILVILIGILVGMEIDETPFISNVRQFLGAKPTPTPTLLPTPSPTPDPTANWKTYTNTRFGYSIKYPENWTITREETDKPAFKSLVQLTQSNFKTLPNFAIQVSNKSYTSLLTSSMKTYQLADTITAMREDTVTGAGNSDYFVNIVFQNSDTVFNIQATFTNPPDQNELTGFNQILSTFKFNTVTSTTPSTVDTVKATCISQMGSSKYWNDTYNECEYSSDDPVWIQKLQSLCETYHGTFNPQASTCRHAVPGEPCGPQPVMVCSF